MRQEFRVHKLSDEGLTKTGLLADSFSDLLDRIEDLCGKDAIVRTKLEEACFFAKKALASKKENQYDIHSP